MLQGKWYKVYFFPPSDYGRTLSKAKTMRVYAFSFTSAANTVKIKLSQEKNLGYDPEKINITRIDFLGR